MFWLLPFIKIALFPVFAFIAYQLSKRKKDVIDLAWDAKELGENKKAVEFYDQAIVKEPKNWMMYLYRGQCKARDGNKVGATEDFNMAIELNPKYSDQAKKELEDLEGGDIKIGKEIDDLFK